MHQEHIVFILLIITIILLILKLFIQSKKLHKLSSQFDEIKNQTKLNEKSVKTETYLSRFLPKIEYEEVKISSEESHPINKKTIELDVVDDKKIQANNTKSILENLLNAGIECKHECGGNARCSTCRIIVLEGIENCLPRNLAETELAKKKSFSEEIRLACQTYSSGNLKLRRLVLDKQDIETAVNEGVAHNAIPKREEKLAILFCDIRSFTNFSEKNYPYDVIHMLNRYFNEIGKEIDENSGYIDKYMGDGIMVLFGLNPKKGNPSVHAIQAGLGILNSLENINSYLRKNFHIEFKIGIGIDYGNVLIGEIGYKLKMQFTAIGDTVNMASRIEGMTKKTHSNFLISDSTYQSVKDLGLFEFGKKFRTEIRGKSGLYVLHEVLQKSGN